MLFHPHIGGGQIHVHELSRKLTYKGVEIVIITSLLEGCLKHEYHEDFEVYRVGEQKLITSNNRNIRVSNYIYNSLRKVKQLHSEKKFDLLHSHIYPGALAGFVSSKILGLKHIVTVHGIYHDLWKEISPSWSSIFNTINERIILRLPYDKMICVSNSVSDRLQRVGVPPQKLESIRNGVDFKKFNPDICSDLRHRLKIGEEPLITFFGSLIPVKGLHYLVRSIPLIKKKFKDAKFLIVGEGFQKNSITELAKKLDISDALIFHNYVPHSSIAAYLNETDVVVVPSLMEGGALIPLEAMACKTAVVATRVGGIPEVVKNGQTGILIEPRSSESIAQGIITILNDKSMRNKITSNAYEYVKANFSWGMVADKTIHLYNSVLESN